MHVGQCGTNFSLSVALDRGGKEFTCLPRNSWNVQGIKLQVSPVHKFFSPGCIKGSKRYYLARFREYA